MHPALDRQLLVQQLLLAFKQGRGIRDTQGGTMVAKARGVVRDRLIKEKVSETGTERASETGKQSLASQRKERSVR